MKINIYSVGKRMPDWVDSGVSIYLKRLTKEFKIKIIEVPPGKAEDKILEKIPPNSYNIALDPAGSQWSTEQLSENLNNWQHEYKTINFMIGGADGISKQCLARANISWSLGKLIFPHMLVRIILCEQIYRSWSILTNHPYHRGE